MIPTNVVKNANAITINYKACFFELKKCSSYSVWIFGFMNFKVIGCISEFKLKNLFNIDIQFQFMLFNFKF